jgi:hypothetical protein
MAKFEAERFCAKAKLQFGIAPALVETFLKNAAQFTGHLSFHHPTNFLAIFLSDTSNFNPSQKMNLRFASLYSPLL